MLCLCFLRSSFISRLLSTEAKTRSVLYRICGTARVDRESVDASLKGSTGERSGVDWRALVESCPPNIGKVRG